MANLKKILKEAAIGAFVPGSIAYNCAKGSVEWDKADDIKAGIRKDNKTTLKDIFYGGIIAANTGMYDLAMYALYGASFTAATGIDIFGMWGKFASNPNYAVAAGAGLFIAGARAGLNILYKEHFDEQHKELVKNLEEKGLAPIQ